MNGRCYHCSRPLTTGDFDGLCSDCRKQSQEVKFKENEELTLEQRALNGLANFIIMHGNNDDYDASAIEWHGILKQAVIELEDLRESNKEMRKLLDEAYSKLSSENNCAKGAMK